MWSGNASAAAIPLGWALCDGRAVSGFQTPNLTNRFIVGAAPGGRYATGDKGGSDTVQLTTAQLPPHNHQINLNSGSSGNHSHNILITDPGHSHLAPTYNAQSGAYEVSAGLYGYDFAGAPPTTASYTGITASSAFNGFHSHLITGNTNDTGSGTPIDTRPSYYALAFIVRVF